MKIISLLFVALVATVSSQDLLGDLLCQPGNDLIIGANFAATEDVVSQQQVWIYNNNSGSGFTNDVEDVSFTVTGLGLQVNYGNNARHAEVGTILAGATGWSSFSVRSHVGTLPFFVVATYRKAGHILPLTACKEFTFHSNGHKRSEFEQDYSLVEATEDFSLRVDVTITPTSFNGEDSTTVWNSFVITTGASQLNNCTFGVIPSDLSVIIGYPGTGNYVGSIAANTAYTTSISVYGNGGDYTLNCTLKYKKGSASSYSYYSVNRPLFISGGAGTSSVKRLANDALSLKERAAVASNSAANGVQYVRADLALGLSVAGIALVAIVAVVAAMVVLRRRTADISA